MTNDLDPEILASFTRRTEERRQLIADVLSDLVLARESVMTALMRNAPGLLIKARTQDWLERLLAVALDRLDVFRVEATPGNPVPVHPFVGEYCAPASALFAPDARGQWLERGFRTSGKNLLAAVEFLLFIWQELDICAACSPDEIAANERLAPILRVYRIIR